MTEKKTKILLAEDNKANQFISKAMIETLGVSVEIAENGFEVIEMMNNSHFDLVLMDCQMPEMDGFEATEKLRASGDERIANVPIIALTADIQKETKDECLKSGMNDFVGKPFALDDITQVIQHWIK